MKYDTNNHKRHQKLQDTHFQLEDFTFNVCEKYQQKIFPHLT